MQNNYISLLGMCLNRMEIVNADKLYQKERHTEARLQQDVTVDKVKNPELKGTSETSRTMESGTNSINGTVSEQDTNGQQVESSN